MIPLILFVLLGLTILVLFEIRARKENENGNDNANDNGNVSAKDDSGCCGQHLVCERETLLQTNAEIIYYDDEELDTLAGIPYNEYTRAQEDMVREVFNTMQEKDVPGWCRSLQLRNIQLPLDVREEALLIVRECRKK
ncbi:MAG: phospholipase [Paludibacteraceae bacterium]|nr:phospholipase [Paludibacteraceae bacterium]